MKRHSTHRRVDRNAMYLFIRDYIAKHGHSPTVREIGTEFGDRSNSVVRHALARLERDGKINRKPGVHRSITIVDKETE